MEQDPGSDEVSPGAAAVLQVCTTVASVALALGALLADRDPDTVDRRDFVSFLLYLVGLTATGGAAQAMVELWRRAGLRPKDMLGLRVPLKSYPYNALVLAGWALLLLAVAFFVLIADALIVLHDDRS